MAEVEGLKELNKKLASLAKIIPNKALLKGALVLQRESMINSPVKTGFLRESHESVETSEGAEMRVNAEYAYYVEFGTSKMQARPYVRPAIDTKEKEILSAVADEIQKNIDKEAK